MSAAEYSLCQELPALCWIRFRRPYGPVSQADVDAGTQFLVVARLPNTDEILLVMPEVDEAPRDPTCRWKLGCLMKGGAEFTFPQAHYLTGIEWHPVGGVGPEARS